MPTQQPPQPPTEYASAEIFFEGEESMVLGRCTMQQMAINEDILVVITEKGSPESTYTFMMSKVTRVKLVASQIERVAL